MSFMANEIHGLELELLETSLILISHKKNMLQKLWSRIKT